MADYRLSGFTPTAPLGLSGSTGPAANNGGFVRSSNADWATAKAGSSESATADALSIKAAAGFVIERTYLQFEIPNNLSRLDEDPQLTLYVDSSSGTDTKVFITSISYATGFSSPWSGWTPAHAWDSAQTADSAAYVQTSGGYYETLADGLNTITLSANSGLAKFHCLNGGVTQSGIKYITIALLNYTYDRQSSSPSNTNTIALAAPSHANGPTLILRKPWFINNRGQELSVGDDYTIRAFDVGVNQRDRSVPQLPFSSAIKGPAFLRGKNSSYKVTS